ncbi:sodium:calcium antiporter [Nafulsella turpanensis]|uniref:sodium:calcium antiporter n=1 Tax=Nafulsella turpanensis TaxID=1265690 RepID=UPI000344A6AE|nr:sodium:calcium antiporter [Nafulsella turpanensis]
MNFLNLESLATPWLAGVFLAGAVIVWLAGFKLSVYANAISNRTGIGKVFIGALMLGAITSLPEVATTLVATFRNNVSLAVNNIIGGVAFQVAILAVADYFVKHVGVTTLLRRGIILLQALLLISILCITIIGALVTDVAILGIGLSIWIILLSGILSFYLIKKNQGTGVFLELQDPAKKKFISNHTVDEEDQEEMGNSLSDAKLYTFTFLLALGVLVGGFFCARAADVLAHKTGLGSSFMGVFFLAIATSLPELSTSISAMRIRQYDLAFSDIFGTNIFDILLICLIDLVYSQELVMNKIEDFSVIGAALGIILTSIFLVGILLKSRKRIGNFGLDSLLVMVVYLAGLFLLYSLK